jgi:hypothetical protein
MQRQDPQANEFISPGSFMGSSVQSHQLSSFDLEEVSSSGGASWRIGMPWFRNGNRPSPVREHLVSSGTNEEPRYFGGLMKSGLEAVAQPATIRNQRKPTSLKKLGSGTAVKVSHKAANEDDSLADFNESEWTQQDSAYGAACPVCGFIPKHVRRMIEFSMIAGMLLGFVYLLVTTSIHINNDRNGSVKNNSTSSDYHGGQIALDDDLYVEYSRNQNDDKAYAAADDDANENNDVVVDDYYGNDDDIFNDDMYDDYFGGGRLRKRLR